jgi:hypothetical protein
MIKRQAYLFLVLAMAFTACVKETYNMNKLSDAIHYSPTFGMSVATGEISLSDIMKPSDTVVYDSDKFVRIVFTQDSVINLKLKDFYDLTDMVAYNSAYNIGDMHITDFQSNYSFTLGQMNSTFVPSMALTNGTPSPFPPFNQSNINLSLPSIDNFTEVVFATGNLDLSIKNTLPVALATLKIQLKNSDGTLIGGVLDFSPLATGVTKTKTIDLAGKRVTNSITAVIIEMSSAGSVSPVPIDFNNGIDLGINGTLLKIRSGHAKIPVQLVVSIENKDTISFDPGSNVEIEKFKLTTGNLSYTLTSASQIRATFVMTLPSTDLNGNPVTKTIDITTPNTVKTGNISLNGASFDLNKDIKQPYNRLPVAYAVTVTSNGNMIDFSNSDNINVEFGIKNPDYDYVKGYFGQSTQNIDQQSIEIPMGDMMDKITGDFHISNPSISLNYSNSFGIPINIALKAKGSNNSEIISFQNSFPILYPTTLATRDIAGSYTINKTNSPTLPDLISLPPSVMEFSGSASMNTGGMTAIGGRNNYVFGNSRFLGSVEFQLPMEFWMNNLQFADTLDNFLSTNDSQNNDFSSSDIDYTRLDISVNNGFPLGISLKLALYDSVRNVVLKTIDASQLLTPAPVDASGKVNGTAASVTSIEINPDFFDSVNDADKIIFIFKLNTTGSGANDIKLYSDYTITFNAAIVVKPEINLK